jgi:arsenite methyltransferase
MTLQFDERESRRVEAIYLTPDMVAQRTRVLEALALRPRERVLDLGCGPGLLAAKMAPQVGPQGEVQCIDASESMMSLAERRCAEYAQVRLQAGDVTALPYADASFDAAVCTQVYEYVTDLERALSELHRVLRTGGRAVVVDTDWESCVWHCSDPGRMRRVIEAWDTHCPHPHLPRTLAARLRAAGLDPVRIEPIVILNDRYDPDTYSFGMMDGLAAYARKRGALSESEVQAWRADLAALGSRGETFFSLTRYLFVARRPAAPPP